MTHLPPGRRVAVRPSGVREVIMEIIETQELEPTCHVVESSELEPTCHVVEASELEPTCHA